MATQPQTRYTYADLETFPEDNLRREIIDGELIVTAAPRIRHQAVVARLIGLLMDYSDDHGGQVFPAPTDVFLADDNVVEPDVIFVAELNRHRLEEKFLRGAPDLAVEISSPTTRRLELVHKLELYQRFGVPEYWYVDLDADLIDIFELTSDGTYGRKTIKTRGESFQSSILPGLTVNVDSILGPTE